MTGTVTNLAIVPGTMDPISTFTIRDLPDPPPCPDVNPTFFDKYNLTPGLMPGDPDPVASSSLIAFNGQTVPMTAQSNVVSGRTYNIKLVVADQGDAVFDIGVFLEAGSFKIGVDLGDDLTVMDDTALCDGDTTTFDASPGTTSTTGFEWQFFDTISGTFQSFVPPELSPMLTVGDPGEYKVIVTFDSGCTGEDTVVVEIFNPPMGTDTTDTVCSDVALAHDLNADVSTTSTFVWKAIDNPDPNVTGEQTTDTPGDIINDAVTNTSAIPQLVRYEVIATVTGPVLESNAMDNFTYHYQAGTNQLTHVSDNVTVVPDDGNPDLTSQNANNYTYNSIGQLVNNAQDKIAYTYNTSGLVTKVESTDPAVNYSIEFTYNDRNHRTRKRVLQDGNTTDTYYVRDAAGQVMAIYNDVVTSNGPTVVKEYPIYGASRLGVDNGGNKRYEITDHLGNVRAVVQHPTTIIDGGGGTPTEVVVFEDDFNDGTVDPWLSYPLPSQPVPVIDNGRLKMTLVPGNQGVPGAYTPINFLAGHEYLISMVIKGTPSQTFIGGIQTTNNTDNQSVSFSQQGSQSMTFTTNETATYNLYFAPIPSNSAPSYLLSIDDVKIRDLTAEGDLPPDETTITSEMLLMYRDYFPFGMVMPDLNTEGDYRYAFQGQEKDPETGKEAFELRLWDGRIGRWLTTDPYGQYSSPYLGMGNNPISRVDPDGGIDWALIGLSIERAVNDYNFFHGDGGYNEAVASGFGLEEVFISNAWSGDYDFLNTYDTNPNSTVTDVGAYVATGWFDFNTKYVDYSGEGTFLGASAYNRTGDGTKLYHPLAIDVGLRAAVIDAEVRGEHHFTKNISATGGASAFAGGAKANLNYGFLTGEQGRTGYISDANAGLYGLQGDVTGGVNIYGLEISGTLGGSLLSLHAGQTQGIYYDKNTNKVHLTGHFNRSAELLGINQGIDLAIPLSLFED